MRVGSFDVVRADDGFIVYWGRQHWSTRYGSFNRARIRRAFKLEDGETTKFRFAQAGHPYRNPRVMTVTRKGEHLLFKAPCGETRKYKRSTIERVLALK